MLSWINFIIMYVAMVLLLQGVFVLLSAVISNLIIMTEAEKGLLYFILLCH